MRRLPLATAVAALFLSTAACGSDEPDPVSSDPSATVATPTPTTAQPPSGPASSAEPTPDEPTEVPTTEPTTEPTASVPPAPPPTTTVPTPAQPTKAPPEVDAVPTTYDEALDRFDATGQEPLSTKRFTSPDGNLYCVLDNDYLPAACEIDRGAVRDPAFCGSGPSEVVGRIEFADGDPQPVCNSDTIREPGAKRLAVGSVAGWSGTTWQCLLEEIGLTCIDTAAPAGFFLGRGRYEVF